MDSSPRNRDALSPMMDPPAMLHRRGALGAMACGALLSSSSLFTSSGAFAEELTRTATVGEGPFYPDKMPLDTDNDLLIVNNGITPAVGEITHLSGRVLTKSGAPLRNAFVEIWQVDSNACYIHSGSANANQRDTNFQGYGRFLTDSTGAYYFRTIKPVPYPGRTPHIHFAVSRNGKRLLTTQMLIKGHPGNQRDGLFRNLTDPADRASVLVDFDPIEDSKIGALKADFDLVLGKTAFEDDEGKLRGGIAPSNLQQRRSRG